LGRLAMTGLDPPVSGGYLAACGFWFAIPS
jgi:hypothetical protein